MIESLSLIPGKRVREGETLIFFDGVQEAPDLVTYAKYLVQDGRFPLIMSGSMLGVELTHVKSFPVGYLDLKTMYPLSFLEFAAALGVPSAVTDMVEEHFINRLPIDEGIHTRLVDAFRLFVIFGGMPEAAQAYLKNGYDLGASHEVQRSLVALYKEGIAKHAGDRALQVKAIYDSIPSQLNKENKRFLFKQIHLDARFERYANDFAWLVGTRAALKTVSVRDPRPMLKRSAEESRFKI